MWEYAIKIQLNCVVILFHQVIIHFLNIFIMKNFLKISLIAVLFLNSAGLYANEGDFSFRVKRVNEKSIGFFINEAQVVEVSLYGSNNEVLYKQKIKAKTASNRIYDLNSFPNGYYTFKLETESTFAEYKVEIKDGETVVSEPVVVEKIVPLLTKEDNIVTLTLGNGAKGPIVVQIYNDNSELVYDKTFESADQFVKRFNVARVDINELNFVIKFDNQEFTQIVQIH